MNAVDTNLIIRFLTQDDPHQSPLAEQVMQAGVFVSHSVLMETEWVLRSRYGLSREAVATSLRGIVEFEKVSVDEPELVDWAIDRYGKGADLADMFHLIAARHQESFVTFDQGLARRAAADGPLKVELLK